MHTMTMASCWVGLTLPGMIEEPGSFSGSRSSPSPQRGPEASQRMSLATLISATASPRTAAMDATIASREPRAVNLFGARSLRVNVFLEPHSREQHVMQVVDNGLRQNDRLLTHNEEPALGSHLVTPRFGFAHHGIYVGGGKVVHYGAIEGHPFRDRCKKFLSLASPVDVPSW
jgi:Lecithin retinol acyltransferase